MKKINLFIITALIAIICAAFAVSAEESEQPTEEAAVTTAVTEVIFIPAETLETTTTLVTTIPQSEVTTEEVTTTVPFTTEPIVTTTVTEITSTSIITTSDDTYTTTIVTDIPQPDTIPDGSKYGDANLDDTINISDVVALNMYLLNSSDNSLSIESIANSDVVRDNIINTEDSLLLMNYVAMIVGEDVLGK